MKDDLAISLIICTRNRCQSLALCLEHVRRLQMPPGGEVIVVDNGSTDGTAEVLRRFAGVACFPVSVIYEPVPGLGGARNAGLAWARGRVIAFTDDDCYVRPDFLLQVLDVFQDPHLGYAGGRILLFDPTDDVITTKPDAEGFALAPHSFLPPGILHGANMAVRREVVSAIGGFDSRLGAGTAFPGEDIDYLARASNSGWAGGYFPGPVVYHHHGRKPGRDALELRKRYDHGRGAYFTRFVWNRSTRSLYLKHWLWAVRTHLRNGRLTMLWRELRGAIHFAWMHVRRRTQPFPGATRSIPILQLTGSSRALPNPFFPDD
jgi:glycosyltransferase involved in cell wall biosynthesis